jgi:hypothetical protein
VTVEFDYKQLETERKQNESQGDVMTVCYTQFGRVSGKYIFLKHNFRTQQKETQNVAHQLATCNETLTEFRKTYSFHSLYSDRAILFQREFSSECDLVLRLSVSVSSIRKTVTKKSVT